MNKTFKKLKWPKQLKTKCEMSTDTKLINLSFIRKKKR